MVGQRWDESQGNLSDFAGGLTTCRQRRVFRRAEEPTRIPQQAPTGRRQRNLMSRSIEEASSDICFERPNLTAQRRLRNAQRIGGAAKVQPFSDRNEGSKMTKLHAAVIGFSDHREQI